MISIILPTFNSLSFLKERVDSILNQTYKDWECIVIDGESTDGTWTYLEKIAVRDMRFKMFQHPPKGVYNAWNIGVQKAAGAYIYFATSDDTMSNDCLEHLLHGFELAPECGISHCCLQIIDEYSQPLKSYDWNTFPAQEYFKNYNSRKHIRKAPLTGLLYATHQTVIHSFTQVLISKKVFERSGYFLEDKGPAADLEWGMRVGLTEDVIHIPREMATWRVHGKQLTAIEVDDIYTIQLIELMRLAICNSTCTSEIKSLKKYLLAWKKMSLFAKLSLYDKLINLQFLNLKISMRLFPDFHRAFESREAYQFYLQGKLDYSKEELIEIVE